MNGKRRGRGAGHLFKRGKIWYLQYDLNGKRHVVSLHTSRRRNLVDESGNVLEVGAEERAKEYLAPAAATTRAEMAVHIAEAKGLVNARRLALEDAWALFERRYSKRKAGTATLDNYKRQWVQFRKWLAAEYPNVAHLTDITEDMALAYCDHLEHDKKLAASTFNQHRGLLKLLFDVLRRDAGLSANPWDVTERMENDTVSRRELSEPELLELLAVQGATAEERALLHIGAWTGLRLRDAILLAWADVDLIRGIIAVTPAKTRRYGTRVQVPIHPTLREHLTAAAAWRRNEYVLPSLAKKYTDHPDMCKSRVVELFELAGFETRQAVQGRKVAASVVGFHSLRHSFVSFCAAAGVPLAAVQAVIGHSSPAMTRHYTHLGIEAAQRAVAALPCPDTPRHAEPEPERAELRKMVDELPLAEVRRLLAQARKRKPKAVR